MLIINTFNNKYLYLTEKRGDYEMNLVNKIAIVLFIVSCILRYVGVFIKQEEKCDAIADYMFIMVIILVIIGGGFKIG